MARDHRVLIVVVSLPGKQVILVHFFLDISHVTVRFERLTAFYLIIEVKLVCYNGLISLISSVLVVHTVEDVHSLSLIDIVLSLSLIQSGFLFLIVVQLFKELPIVFTFELLLVISGNSCSLVQHLIGVGICLCLVVFVL